MEESFACLGFEILGGCSYNPAHPTTYLTIGNAVSALGFTLAIQQLLKPLYRFRLRAYGISFPKLSIAMFIGFSCTVIAALLPNLPLDRDVAYEYPIFWELVATILIVFVYGVTSYLILQPVKIRDWNLNSYIRAAGNFLAEAKDEERVRFAEDISLNISDLFKYANYWDQAEHHFSTIEFERLKEAGKPLSIQGSPPRSAFYMFTHRKRLDQSSLVRSFLLILSDPKFCAVLVKDCPWPTASLLIKISEEGRRSRTASSFIQEIGLQAIIEEDSMLSREVGYEGFAHAPLLAESLFGNPDILTTYRPLNKVSHNLPSVLTEALVKRLNLACELMTECALSKQDYWGCIYLYDMQSSYERVCDLIGRDTLQEDQTTGAIVSLHFGIRKIYELLLNDFKQTKIRRYQKMFLFKGQRDNLELVEIVSQIVFKAYLAISNGFDPDSRHWTTAIGYFMDLFPSIGEEVDGLNPLQQRIMIRFLEKFDHNMDGWYPSLSRVLLALIGPYESRETTTRTAFVLLKNAVYTRLKKNLPKLYAEKPEKFLDFLLPNVEYDPVANKLTHNYKFGSGSVETFLDHISPEDVDPYDLKNWQIPGRQIISLIRRKSER